MTSDFYDLPFARPFFRVVGAIRVSEGRAKRDSFRTALDTLRRGEPVGLFPEGRLSLDGRFTEVMPGVAFLAAKSGAPVVPVRIRGSIRVMPKGRWRPRQANVTLRFGPPMHFTDPRDRTVSARILAAWEAL
jgi:1-acyl-sn-glycerol-3-phosphate acyltransferase